MSLLLLLFQYIKVNTKIKIEEFVKWSELKKKNKEKLKKKTKEIGRANKNWETFQVSQYVTPIIYWEPHGERNQTNQQKYTVYPDPSFFCFICRLLFILNFLLCTPERNDLDTFHMKNKKGKAIRYIISFISIFFSNRKCIFSIIKKIRKRALVFSPYFHARRNAEWNMMHHIQSKECNNVIRVITFGFLCVHACEEGEHFRMSDRHQRALFCCWNDGIIPSVIGSWLFYLYKHKVILCSRLDFC